MDKVEKSSIALLIPLFQDCHQPGFRSSHSHCQDFPFAHSKNIFRFKHYNELNALCQSVSMLTKRMMQKQTFKNADI